MSAAPGTAAPVPLRAARGAAVAAVGLLLAVAGHVAGGGDAAPGSLGLPVALLVLAGCVLASSSSWTRGRLLVALVGVQVVVHGSLLLASPSAGTDPRLAGLASSTAHHAHDHAAALTPAMLAGHVVAVGLAALLLARVDVAVVVLWHLARRVLLPVLPAAVALRYAAGTLAAPAPVRVRTAARTASASRRGPPATCCA